MPEKNTLKLLCVLYLNKNNFIEYATSITGSSSAKKKWIRLNWNMENFLQAFTATLKKFIMCKYVRYL